MSDKTGRSLTLSWDENILTVRGAALPAEGLTLQYLEAVCRPGSTDRDWGLTCIPFESTLISRSDDGTELRLENHLADGAVLRHVLAASADEIDFHVEACNPTDTPSEAHWAQPCIRVGRFTGFADEPGTYEYIRKCFIFLDGKLTRLPTEDWATEAPYTPGQEWCPADVPRTDVGPRPVNVRVPSNGLIGCFSADEKTILATAWQPYQMLFQGVIGCIHSDFRIGGLAPGQTKHICGKLYVVPNDVPALLVRYEADFPEHSTG